MAILFCLQSKRYKSCLNKLKTSVKLPEVSHEKDITSQPLAMNFKGRVPKNHRWNHESRASCSTEGIHIDLYGWDSSSLHLSVGKQLSWAQAPGVLMQPHHWLQTLLEVLDDPLWTRFLFRRNKPHPVALLSALIAGTEKANKRLTKKVLEVITEWLLNTA